jgi:transcriptional regulator with XRE-family HTH domain
MTKQKAFLGDLIRRKRGLPRYVRARLSLQDVAQFTGVSVSTLSRIERAGCQAASLDAGTVARLCKWLGVPPEKVVL